MATTTLTVDRVTRDVLHSEISMELGGVGGLGKLDDRAGISRVHDEREKIDACFALLDAVGWAEDDQRQTFELPCTERTVTWVNRTLQSAEEGLTENRGALRKLEEGDESRCFIGSSMEESVRQTRTLIEEDEQVRDVLGRLAERLNARSEPAACDACEAPAVYRWEYRPGVEENLCEECARYRGSMDRGEASMAFDVLGFAVAIARRAGVTEAQLREAFEVLVAGRNSSVNSYPCGVDGVLGADAREDRPWQWRGVWERLPDEAVAVAASEED